MNEEFRRWWAQNHPTERAAVEISETYRAAQDGWRKTPTYHEVRDIIAKHVAAASSPAPASPAPTPEQIVYNVAQRDPFFRKHLIEQLVAMGDEQDTGPLRTLPEGEQECQRCGKTGGKVVSFNCGSLTTARWVCPYCLDAATPTTPSAAAMRAAEEIAANYEVHKDHCHSNERYPSPPCDCGATEEIAAIITRRLGAGQEWLPIETAPRGIDILLLWEDEHMQIHHFPVVEKPSFWFENAPIKWRHLPPLPNAAATPSPETAAAKEGWTPEQFARLMPELSEEERARILAETAVGGEVQKINEDGELTSTCKHCGEPISQTKSTGSWYHDSGWSRMCTKLNAAPVNATGDDKPKVVRSKDVLDAIDKTFNELGRHKMPANQAGLAVYQGLARVPEFYAEGLTEVNAVAQDKDRDRQL